MRNTLNWSNSCKKTVTVAVTLELTENDIFNWLIECQNPDTLKYLGRAALKFARDIESQSADGWHSDVLG